MTNTLHPAQSAALGAAQAAIRAVAATALPAVAHTLLFRVKNASTYHERSQLAFAQTHILEAQEMFLASFATFLRQGVEDDVGLDRDAGAAAAPKAATDWQSIGLVDEGRIEESIAGKRIGQLISHNSEAELKELDGYAAALVGRRSADAESNPLRGDVVGAALQKAIEKITDDSATQKILAREFGQALADAMPACYRELTDDLKKRGVRPVGLELRGLDEAGHRPGDARAGFDDARKNWEQSWVGRTPPPPPGSGSEALRTWESSILGRHANTDVMPSGLEAAGAAALLDRLMRGALPPQMQMPQRGMPPTAAEMQLTELLRRMNAGAIQRGEFERTQPDTSLSSLDPGASMLAPDGFAATPMGELSSLMAVNIIRAHREELESAARSKVDHLVIEVVSSLFDQILSDRRVPPQMARQLARLQLPVLRIALVDPRFFSSRRHPVRRFINRVASLACAFDEFDSGAGEGLLQRVSALVNEIVEGDFDQLDVYDAKVDALQRFVDDQTHAQVRDSAAAPTLREKEIEWRQQRRFGEAWFTALEPLGLPAFVRDFLCGTWAQAVVLSSRRDGPQGEYPQKLRRVAADLVTSLQPKRSIEERKRFVSSLPKLMADLTAGMAYVDAPVATRDAFFGDLISVHAGSLKAPPTTDLDHNMRLRALDVAVRMPLPDVGPADADLGEVAGGDAAGAVGAVGSAASMAASAAADVEPQFSPEEERSIGLVSENAVDWSSTIDGVPAAPPAAGAAPVADAAGVAAGSGAAPASAAAVASDGGLPTIDLDALDAPALAAAPAAAGDAAPAEADGEPIVEPELAGGASLRDHLQLGFSYQLNLKGRWEKVRLTYMSPGRTLFLFAHGAKGRETVSMTTRTLGRLCETGRMRAFEQAFLLDRSTERARKQLAALGGGAAAAPALA